MDQKPWMIMAVFPGHLPRAIARTCHKADADAQVRFLRRYLHRGRFYVLLDPDQADLVELEAIERSDLVCEDSTFPPGSSGISR